MADMYVKIGDNYGAIWSDRRKGPISEISTAALLTEVWEVARMVWKETVGLKSFWTVDYRRMLRTFESEVKGVA